MSKNFQPHEKRVIDEKDELRIKLDALILFLQKGQPSFIDDKNWHLLQEQADAMNHYYTILVSRIELFEGK